MSHAIVVRRLQATDAELFRAIRLEALEAHPAAFAASLESERGKPLSHFVEMLQDNILFAACRDTEVLGIAGFHRFEPLKERHRGLVWTVYVRAAARGVGAADLLMRTVIAHARETGTETLLLAVGAHNEAAQHLYRRHGFVEYGRDQRALKVGDDYYDEIMMRLELPR